MYSFPRVGWLTWLAVAVIFLGCVRTAPRAVAAPVTTSVTVKGTVLLPDGQPAVGARVVSGWGSWKSYDLTETAADAAGKFTLTLPAVPEGVAAILPGHPLALARVRAGQEIRLRLADYGATVSGTVVDQHGKPVAGAQVMVESVRQSEGRFGIDLMGQESDCLPQTVTGVDGRYVLRDLPLDVNVNYRVQAPGLTRVEELNIETGAEGRRTVLSPEATLSGRLTAEGRPVAGAKISYGLRAGPRYWFAGQGTAVTGADGTYRLEHLAAGDLSMTFSRVPDGWAAPIVPPITLKAAEHLAGKDFALTPGALVTGKVTNADTGAPIAGARVGARVGMTDAGGESGELWATTDAAGVYHLRVPPGAAQWGTTGPSLLYGNSDPTNRGEQLAEGQRLEGQDFALEPSATLHGKVLLSTGQPAVGAVVFPVGQWNGTPENTATDATGSFSMPLPRIYLSADMAGLPPPLFVAQLEGYALGSGILGNAEKDVLVLRLGEPAAFAGTVTDTKGQPVSGAVVELQDPASSRRPGAIAPKTVGPPKVIAPEGAGPQPLPLGEIFLPVVTGRDGRFSFEGLPAGMQVNYLVKASGDVPTRGAVAVGAGCKLVLPPEAVVAGRVTAGGKPVGYVTVRTAGREPFTYSCTTQADGSYRLTGLAAGTYTVEAEPERGGESPLPPGYAGIPSRQITLTTGQHLPGQDLAFPRGEGVSGRVTAGGKPVAGVMVVCPDAEEMDGSAITDANGVYHLGILHPGTHELLIFPGSLGPEANGQPLPEGYVAPPPTTITVAAGGRLTGPDIALLRCGTFSGKVTDRATGNPMAKLKIAAWRQTETPESNFERLMTGDEAETETDAQGVYKLPVKPGKWMVSALPEYPQESRWAVTPEQREAEVTTRETRSGVDFVISRPALLHGRVLRPDGQPAAGALIGCAKNGYSWEQILPGKTGADGSFTVEAYGSWGRVARQVDARHPVRLFAVDLAQGLATTVEVTDATQPLTVQLQPGAYATVRVTDPAGRPLRGIYFRGEWWPPGKPTDDRAHAVDVPDTKSDAQGMVKIGPLPPGTIEDGPCGPEEDYVASEAWRPKGRLRPQMVITGGGTQAFPDLVIDRLGLSVCGWVTDAQGQPVANAVVIGVGYAQITGMTGEAPSCRSDARGFFTITRLPLMWGVALVAGHPTKEEYYGQRLTTKPGEQVSLVLRPLGGLTGQIVDEQHKPVAGVQVHPDDGQVGWYPLTDMLIKVKALLGRPGPDAKRTDWWPCDAQGRFRVEGMLAPMQYTLQVETHEGGGPEFEVDKDRALEVKPGAITDAGQVVVKRLPAEPVKDEEEPGDMQPPPPGAGGPAPK